jgi:outer membrane protein OmpA-like peptidoglycan-associated protein
VEIVIIAIIGALMILLHDEPPPPAPPKGSSLVVVLPEADGKVGTVVVRTDQGETRLDTAYAAARIDHGTQPARSTLSEGEVNSLFAVALAARPVPPVSFTLYFITGKDEITTESSGQLDSMFAELKRRPAPEVSVIGHTDRVGSDADNDRLSLRRAERVREDLVRMGVSPEAISVAGRGEREPLVPTADSVDEPRNRRVEINVR